MGGVGAVHTGSRTSVPCVDGGSPPTPAVDSAETPAWLATTTTPVDEVLSTQRLSLRKRHHETPQSLLSVGCEMYSCYSC